MSKVRSRARGSALAAGAALVLAGAIVAVPEGTAAAPDQELELTQYVDPLIGTAIPSSSGYQGNIAPGAQVPFGMVNFGPDMPRSNYNGSGGYTIGANASSGTINFFSVTHLNGPGCPGAGVVGMMPSSTPTAVSNGTGIPRPATFQTADESVAPGYFRTEVTRGSDPKVRAEFTSTTRTGMARFTYPDADSGYYSVDTKLNGTSNSTSTRGRISPENVDLQISEDGKVLTGKTVAPAFCIPWGTYYNSNVYFYAEFDKGLRAQSPENDAINTVTNGAALLQYDLTEADPTLTMRVGISSVSLENAKLNLKTENADSSFDEVREAADADWNARLNTVQIDRASDPESLTAEQRSELTEFYTALYRVFVSPTTYSDVNGDYRSMKAKEPYQTSVDQAGFVEERPTENVADDAFTRLDGSNGTPEVHYSGLSMWDTYRSASQALALFAPNVASEVMQSLVADAEQCGAFPHWVDGSDDSTPMAGDNALAALAGSYAFGAKDFDLKTAAQYVKQSVFDPTSKCNNNSSSTDLAQYLELGYRPNGAINTGQPASSNIESNAADHAAGVFLNSLPKEVLEDPSVAVTTSDIAKLNDRSTWWKNNFNYETGVLAQRGLPTEPGTLGPLQTGNFHESTEPNYFWSFGYAWQDLIDAIGGKENAIKRLNALFSLDDELTATPTRNQLNGGQSARTLYIGNEPALPAPWAYNWAGKPHATQYIVQQIMKTAFTPARDGLPGNDDYGAMSSYYVFSALGMFPVAQAHAGFALSTPQFPAMTVHFGDKTLRIETSDDALSTPFIDSMTINGEAHDSSWITLDKLLAESDNTVSFELISSPTSAWATTGEPRGIASSNVTLELSADSQDFETEEPVTASAAVVFSDGVSQPGSVELRSGNDLVGQADLAKGGSASIQIPPDLAPGEHDLVATFVPTDKNRVEGASSESVKFTVITDEADQVAVTLSPTTRIVAGKVYLATGVTNIGTVPVNVEIETAYGNKTFEEVLPGKTVSIAMNSRLATIESGTVTVNATGIINGVEKTITVTETYDAAGAN